jgi:heptosyltransferase-3
MSVDLLPPPGALARLLIWHQGALGDLLLAGPALEALSRHYSGARFTALGHPERWSLLSRSLPLRKVWDSGEARWSPLVTEGALPAALVARLAGFQLALVFSPRPATLLQAQLRRAGIPAVHRLPSFPETGDEAVAGLQARYLEELGLEYIPAPFTLEVGLPEEEEPPELPGPGPWLAVAPGSGQLLKNWPLAHYGEVSRELAREYGLQVVWLAGPAEEAMLPELEASAQSQGQVLLANRPLLEVARVLSRCRLYLGNDSGLTHLAAAVGKPGVIALFGPTDPRVWAPLGPRVRILAAPGHPALGTQGRSLGGSGPQGLAALSPDTVLAAAVELLAAPGPKKSDGA